MNGQHLVALARGWEPTLDSRLDDVDIEGEPTLDSRRTFNELNRDDGSQVSSYFAFSVRDRLLQDGVERTSKNADDPSVAFDDDDDLWKQPVPHLASHKYSTLDVPVQVPDSQPIAEQWGHLTPRERRRRARRKELRARDAGQIKQVSGKRRTASTPLRTDVDPNTLPVSNSGWIGSQTPVETDRAYTVEELIGPGYGMKLVEWDGRTSMPIVDVEGRVIGVLAGRPRGSGWDEVVAEATSEMAVARAMLHGVEKKQLERRRGRFHALAVGVSFGGGQTKPSNLRSSNVNGRIVEALLNSESFSRMAGFASSMFSIYSPNVFKFYKSNFDALLCHQPALRRNFPGSVFAAASFNLGPITITRPHLDRGNLAWGWCAITALGSFNPDLGGHLILWDLGIVVRFPGGSTILIPSAILKHSNTKIHDGEIRCSFTQYTAGGLLRWVYNGFRTDKSVLARAGEAELQKRESDRLTRWSGGLDMFSKVSDLVK